jgi:heptosyltransferase-2
VTAAGQPTPPRARRIAVLHFNQIGDLLFSLPLLKSLRAHFPGVHLTSVVPAYLAELTAGRGLADEVSPRPPGAAATWAVGRALRRGRFDLVIALSGSWAQVLSAWLSGAAERVGFADARLGRLLTSCADARGVPCIAKMAAMATHLGCSADIGDYQGLIRVSEQQRQSARSLLAAENGRALSGFAVLAPGSSARRSYKAWYPDRFAAVADALTERHGLATVILGGADDRSEGEAISRAARAGVVNLAGHTTVGEAAGLLADCALFVGIDSGLMHLAAALDRPLVALFGPTDPALTGPRCTTKVVLQAATDCSPCHDPTCRQRRCMDALTAADVLAAADRLLATAGGAPVERGHAGERVESSSR